MIFNKLKETVLYKSTLSVEQISTRLEASFLNSGFTLFLKLDQKEEARMVGMQLPDTIILMVGIPEKGTELMNKYPTIAFELPIKIVITQDEKQETIVLHSDFTSLQKKHDIDTPLFPNLGNLITGVTEQKHHE